MNRKYRFTKDPLKRLKDFIADKRGGQKHTADAAPAAICAGLTDVGKVRAVNQDCLVIDESVKVYGVADGMGGHNGGETASAGARDGVIQGLQGKAPSLDALRSAIEEANAALFRRQAEDEKLAGMGTTLSVLWLSDHFAYLGHVGDSRIYLMRNGEFSQMTDDHSLVGELVRQGHLTPEEAENHPMKNVILRAVGTEETIDVDLAVEERMPGDVWLICSDGLHGMVPDQEMAEVLRSNAPDKAARLLMDAALEAGGRDNISVVILQDGEAVQ